MLELFFSTADLVSASHTAYRRTMTLFMATIPGVGLRAATLADLKRFEAGLLRTDSPSTVNKHLKYLSSM